jgi:hypothetical protein
MLSSLTAERCTLQLLCRNRVLCLHRNRVLCLQAGDASGTGLLDVAARCWDGRLAAMIDDKLMACLPPLIGPDEVRWEWGIIIALSSHAAMQVVVRLCAVSRCLVDDKLMACLPPLIGPDEVRCKVPRCFVRRALSYVCHDLLLAFQQAHGLPATALRAR